MPDTAAANASQELVGRVVAGHKIVRLLGQGGMGSVYLAEHQVLGVLRAIKVIHDDLRGDEVAEKRFSREAMALSRLQHDGVVQIIDFGRLDNGWPYLCTEYIDGHDLDVRIQHQGAMRPPDAVLTLMHLAGALDYAHSQGIIHRDLKPANVILRNNDPSQVKVIDFGLVRVVSDALMTKLTNEQQMVGSPVFMAPEQADGSSTITGAADVYALAGIAYALLSAKPVFPDLTLLPLIYAHSSETPPRLSTRCPTLRLPKRIDDLFYACLAKAPSDRPVAGEVHAHLKQLLRVVENSSAEIDSLGVASTMAVVGDVPATQHAAAGEISVDAIAPSPSPPSRQVYVGKDAELPALIASARVLPDHTGTRDAVINQVWAVINDLGNSLGARDANVGELLIGIDRRDQELSDAALALALVDAELAETTSPEQQTQREHAASRINQLKDQLEQSRYRLLELVAHNRGEAALEPLYGELDELSGRLRAMLDA